MTRSLLCLAIVTILLLANHAWAAEEAAKMPELPAPQKQHAWLEKFAGNWESVSTIQPPGEKEMKVKGTEVARMVGGFWLVSENSSDMMGMPYTGIMTLGYDPKSKTYVGTWIDSMGDFLWQYKGSVEGNTLTLLAEGPCPMRPGEVSKFKETVELKDENHKVFTSSIQEEDGSWTQMLKIEYTRKK